MYFKLRLLVWKLGLDNTVTGNIVKVLKTEKENGQDECMTECDRVRN